MKSVPKQHSIQKEWRSVVKGHDDGFVVDCWLRWLCHLENERLLSSARDLYLPYNKPRLARFNAIRPTFSAFTFIYRITMETENKDMSDLLWFFAIILGAQGPPKKIYWRRSLQRAGEWGGCPIFFNFFYNYLRGTRPPKRGQTALMGGNLLFVIALPRTDHWEYTTDPPKKNPVDTSTTTIKAMNDITLTESISSVV